MYFGLRSVLATAEIGWVCVLCAFPFALGGFFQYNGMKLEKFAWVWFKSCFLLSNHRVWKSQNRFIPETKRQEGKKK